jgi:hypothetical protein
MKNTVKLLVVIAACVFLSSCASQEKVKVRFRTLPLGAVANIYIDDKLIGAADNNQLTIDLKPGEHQVRAVTPEYETAEITVHVKPKGEASVKSAPGTSNNAGIQQLFLINRKKKE